MQKINRKDFYQFDLQRDYIYRNLTNDEIILGKLIDVDFTDDITNPDNFNIIDLKTNQKIALDSSLYSSTLFNLNDLYYFKNNGPLNLTDIELNDENKEGFYIFRDKNEKKIKKPLPKTKLPNSVSFIKNLKDFEIFLKTKGELRIFMCLDVIPSTDLANYQLEISDIQNHEEKLNLTLSELIIRPKQIYFSISKSLNFRESEINLMKWLSKRDLQVYLYLKKPVNNLEIGYIQKININFKNNMKQSSKDGDFNNISILFRNIFGNNIEIPYKKIEMISFKYNTGLFQLKSETSLSSRLGFKILKKFKPERIIIS